MAREAWSNFMRQGQSSSVRPCRLKQKRSESNTLLSGLSFERKLSGAVVWAETRQKRDNELLAAPSSTNSVNHINNSIQLDVFVRVITSNKKQS